MKLKSHNMNVGASIRHLDVDGSLIKEYYYPTSNNGPEPFIEAKVENENGEVTQHEKYPFKSFCYNKLGIARWYMWPTFYNWNFGIKNLSGSNYVGDGSPISYGDGFVYVGSYGWSNNGICVGTSSVTNSMSMINLYGKIEHGNSTDQLGYQQQIIFNPQIISSSYYLTLSRSFINSGSLPVNIKEIGVIASSTNRETNPAYSFLLCRDTKDYQGNDIDINLPTASILTVNYNFIYPDNNHLVKQYTQLEQGNAIKSAVTVRTISSGTYSISHYSRGYNVQLWSSNTLNEDSGIVVGSSSQAFSLDDYKLYGKIPAGTDTSSLYHFPQLVSVDVSGSDSGSFYIERLITNYSPNTFDIEEMGLQNYSSTATNRFLWARTLTGTINLLTSQSLQIKYYWQVIASGS